MKDVDHARIEEKREREDDGGNKCEECMKT
jgi:hypothetical protein